MLMNLKDLRKRPFSRQLGEIEPYKLFLQVIVQINKLAIPPGSQVTTSHVNVKHYILIRLFFSHTVVGNR